MSPELDQASYYLDEALTAMFAGQSEDAYECIRQAAMILDNLGAALQAVAEVPAEKEPVAVAAEEPAIAMAAAA